VSNCLLILLNSLFIVPLRIELVSVLLADLSDNIFGEISITRDLFSFLKEAFLHERVNFNVHFHLIQFAQNHLLVRVLGQVVHCVILDFNLHNARMRSCPVGGDSICKIVDLQSRGCLLLPRLLSGARAAGLKVHRQNQRLEKAHVFLVVFELEFLDFLVAATQRVLANKVFVLVVLFAAAHVDDQRVRRVIKIAAISLQGLCLRLVVVHLDLGRTNRLLNVGVVQNAPLQK